MSNEESRSYSPFVEDNKWTNWWNKGLKPTGYLILFGIFIGVIVGIGYLFELLFGPMIFYLLYAAFMLFAIIMPITIGFVLEKWRSKK